MANEFSKEERVAFETVLEGFQDALILSRNVSVYNTDSTMMQRANDTIWRPMPYIAKTFDRTMGTSIAPNVTQMTQLSVPSTLGFGKSSAWEMDAKELNDALQENRLGDAAKQALASQINQSVMNIAASYGSLVVPIAAAAGDYDDVALCDSIMNEQGIANDSRYLALSSRDYNGLAGNLAVATRSMGNPKSDKAYERSFVGMVAGFDTYKLDYANRLTAAAGSGITINTTGAMVDYAPQATSTSVGGQINVDNRFQTVTVSSTTGVKAGDAFTVAGVYAVHHITKQNTGQLKTFRVISVNSGTTMTICPPIIGATGTPTAAQAQYQNAEVGTTSATAAITFLNVNTASVNPFWHKDAIELMPGRYAVQSGAGADVLLAATDQGIELVMTKKFDPLTFKTLYTMDTLYGVTCTNPEMVGALLFNQ